jgi:hypothetical protein
MIYRNGRTIYYPQYEPMVPGEPIKETGVYQSETFPSINAAKREVRTRKLAVRRGRPPTNRAQAAAALTNLRNREGILTFDAGR